MVAQWFHLSSYVQLTVYTYAALFPTADNPEWPGRSVRIWVNLLPVSFFSARGVDRFPIADEP